MPTLSYLERRGEIATYFDRTAKDAWARLTSDAPVSGIRATVREGRDAMRRTLLDWLPQDLTGRRILDAGCGPGVFAIEAARRGAHVTAVDLSPSLVELGQQRLPADLGPGRVEFIVGDMLNPAFGRFDHVVAMDSLIHYCAADTVRALSRLAARTDASIVFTFAPSTVGLTVMHTIGRLFPRADRAPAIEPVRDSVLRGEVSADPGLKGWQAARQQRVANGFYISEAMELVRV